MIESSSSVLVTDMNSAALSAHEGTGVEGANRQTTKAPLKTDNSNLADMKKFSHVLAWRVVSITAQRFPIFSGAGRNTLGDCSLVIRRWTLGGMSY